MTWHEKLDIVPLPEKFKGTFAQNLFISAVFFGIIGMFNAMNGLGYSGGDDPTISAVMNITLYATMCFFGFFGGVAFKYLGAKLIFIMAGFAYSFYGLSVYLWGENGDDYIPMAVIASIMVGTIAGMFWTAQGALMLSYPLEHQKGTFLSIFWSAFNFGSVIGGLLTFAVNLNASGGKASPATYFVFIGLMLTASLIAFLFVVHPAKVTRSDGSKIEIPETKSAKEEVTSVLKVVNCREMWLLFLLFLQSNWYYTYDFGFNAINFTGPARGLNSSIFFGSQMIAAVLFANMYLDNAKYSRSTRAKGGFFFFLAVGAIQWALSVFWQYHTGRDKGNTSCPLDDEANYCQHRNLTLDNCCKQWSLERPHTGECYVSNYPYNTTCDPISHDDAKHYIPSALLYALMGFNDAVCQCFAYWIMGALTNDATKAGQYAGFYKAVQSIGCIGAWLADLFEGTYTVQMWICIAMFLSCLPGLWMVCIGITDSTDEEGSEPTIYNSTARLSAASINVPNKDKRDSVV